MKKASIIIAIVITLFVLAWFGTISWRKSIASTYMSSGDNLLNQEKYSEAIFEYKKVNFLSPKNPEANYKIGKAYFYSWNLTEASSYFQKAISLDTKYNPAYLAQAEIYLINQKFDDAKAILDKANEKDSLIHLSLARTYFGLNDLSKAQDELGEIQKDQRKLEKYYSVVFALAEESPATTELAPKVKDLESIELKKFTKTEEPIPSYTLTDGMIDNCQKALTQISKISNESSRKIIVAEILIQGEDFAIAIPSLEKVVKENENYRDALVFLGQAYYLDHKYDKAKDTLLNAKNIDPTFGPTWQFLGLTYEALGDKDLSNEAFDKAKMLGKDLE